MAVTANDIVFMYPDKYRTGQGQRVGGACSTFPVLAGEEIFDLAVMYGSSYVQYQKIFIKNNSTSEATGFKIFGENTNANSIISIAVESDQSGFAWDGDESTKDNQTMPRNLYAYGEWLSPAYASGIAVAIPAGSAIGVWLRMEFTSIDNHNEEDIFTIGYSNGTITKTMNLVHSRINGMVDIVRFANTDSLDGILVEYKKINTVPMGITVDDAIYAVYVDRIFKVEHNGGNRVAVPTYGNGIPLLIEVFILPYSGYRPVLDSISSSFLNRVKLNFMFNENDDVNKFIIYWDNATGTYLSKKIGEINLITNNGGGSKIDSITL